MNKETFKKNFPEHCALYVDYLMHRLASEDSGPSSPNALIESPWVDTSVEPISKYPNLLDEVLEGYDSKLMDSICRVIGDFEFRIQTMLLKHFGAKGRFKIEYLTELSAEEKEKFELLVYRMIGHCAFYDDFSDGDSEE